MILSLLNESDLLLHVIHYLTLGSLVRLQQTCRRLNNFIAANQQRIRGLLRIDFYLHFNEERSVILKSFRRGSGRQTLHFLIKSTPPNLEAWQFQAQLNGNVELYKRSRNKDFAFFTKPGLDLAWAVVPISNFLLTGFHFQRATFRRKSTSDFGVMMELLEWLISKRERLSVLCFDEISPREAGLHHILKSLNVEALAIQTAEAQQYCIGEVSEDFFHDLPYLRKLKVPCLNSAIDDEELDHFDVLDVNIGKTQISFDGILRWIQREFQQTSIGDKLKCCFLVSVAEVESRLGHYYYHCQIEENIFFRGPTGRWLCSPHHGIHTFEEEVPQLEMYPSYEDCFACPSSDFREKCWISVTIKLDLDPVTIQFGHLTYRQDFIFNISNEKPLGIGSQLVERWTPSISLYETDFCQLTVYIESADITHEHLRRAFKHIVESLSKWKFNYVRCSSPDTNDSLRLLSLLQESFAEDYHIDELAVCGTTNPEEALLIPILQKFNTSKLKRGPMDSNVVIMVPLMLSSDFFEKTPTLKAIAVDPCTDDPYQTIPAMPHVLEIDDQTLQRFDVVAACGASTNITITGFLSWMTKCFSGASKHREITIALPFLHDEPRRRVFIRQLTEGAYDEDESVYSLRRVGSNYTLHFNTHHDTLFISSVYDADGRVSRSDSIARFSSFEHLEF